MSAENTSRRQFLQTALYSSLLYGVGAAPSIVNKANAMPAPLTNRLLVDLFLDGGPDMRHLVVPAYSSNLNTFGGKYWANRQNSHSLVDSGVTNSSQTAQQRWNQDYYPITVGGTNWNGSLVDVGGLNAGVTFGIWREAGWLIDMFRSGHVALIFNAVGGTDRAHDLSSLKLHQGDVLTTLNNQDRSGWGGRLARSAGGNPIGLTSSPSPFTFGPVGNAPNYNVNAIDNSDLIVVDNSRNLGLFEGEADNYPYNDFEDKLARSAKSYYAAIRNEQVGEVYDKFLSHEFKSRQFGEAIRQRVDSTPIPELIRALTEDIDGINPGPGPSYSPAFRNGRRVLDDTNFGQQIRNLYDMIAWNDISIDVNNETLALNPRVLSMRYGRWDTHADQRRIPNELATDPNNPYEFRGIESGLRNIFGGQFGSNQSDSSALHAGFSALWSSLNANDRDKIVITMAGEFGRQIRNNGDNGTDHGKGNLMFVISERCAGGVYGEMFPQSEIIKYDEPPTNTPDIDPRTEFDHFFAQVCDWVAPGSSTSVFPRMASGFSGDAPIIELPGMFNNLLS